MSVNVISLGKEGKLEDTDLKIDYLMCCYFFSKYSQSTLYAGEVYSLTKVIQLYGSNPSDVRRNLEDDLQAFLSKFFTSASVEVTIDDTGDNPGISLQIAAIVSDGASINSNSSSVGYSLQTNNSQLKSILNITTGVDILNASS